MEDRESGVEELKREGIRATGICVDMAGLFEKVFSGANVRGQRRNLEGVYPVFTPGVPTSRLCLFRSPGNCSADGKFRSRCQTTPQEYVSDF